MVNQKDLLLEIKCNCLPEMKKDRIYKIQIDISSDTSDVTHAECTCPAGKGPHGSYKHVAAALFAWVWCNVATYTISTSSSLKSCS